MGATELTSGDFTEASDPVALFSHWLGEATASEINDANGMALATVDQDGMPDLRMVLLKGVDERGFVFYTNYESAKGQQLLGSMKAALLFHWKSRRRQVRVRGPVEVVTDAEADAYFASRHRQSRLGAIASAQSRPLKDRKMLEDAVSKLAERYGDGDIPRPKHWSGFRIKPQTIEFWQDGAFRLHDRIVFEKSEGGWKKTRLYP